MASMDSVGWDCKGNSLEGRHGGMCGKKNWVYTKGL